MGIITHNRPVKLFSIIPPTVESLNKSHLKKTNQNDVIRNLREITQLAKKLGRLH